MEDNFVTCLFCGEETQESDLIECVGCGGECCGNCAVDDFCSDCDISSMDSEMDFEDDIPESYKDENEDDEDDEVN